MERDPHEILGIERSDAWSNVRSAYLTLARRYHPDGAEPNGPRMAEINAAYDALERQRQILGSAAPPLAPVGPGRPDDESPSPERDGPKPGSLLWRMRANEQADSPILDIGPYAGQRIADVARQDPRYLRGLSRQSNGLRFRRAIEEALGPGR
jgi:curved DNA-binding protein CbpA